MSQVKKRNFGARLNEAGKEVLSKVKKAVHVKIRRPVSEHQRFRQYLDQASKQAALAGEDSYEEFIDFGPDDDGVMPISSYELVFDPRTGKEVLPEEKIWLDKQMAAFEANELKKRKAANAARASAPNDYVSMPDGPDGQKRVQRQGKFKGSREDVSQDDDRE